MSKEAIQRLSQRARDGGAEIVKLVGTSAWFAPAASIVEMVDAILNDRKKILPCSTFLEGEYGISNLFVGVPVKLGVKGIEQVIEISLTNDERVALQRSASSVKELTDLLGV
jgi:malate dehydrogenase